MTDKPYNPPAFPVIIPETWVAANSGMDLKDWFAGQIAIGLLSNVQGTRTPEDMAKWIYAIADAMLKERRKGK
jgi:hypothetical protein